VKERDLLKRLYDALLAHYGPQHWWPGETPFEVMVGAVLTQNTNWQNVARAISHLKEARLLEPRRLVRLPMNQLAWLIRPAGYYNVKARRLKALVRWLAAKGGDPVRALSGDLHERRAELLGVFGVGPETADSILLYAGRRPTFVVDAYTRRILSRHGVVPRDAGYAQIKSLFESSLPRDTGLYNEYHALLVRLGKEECRTAPRCDSCPVYGLFDSAGRPPRIVAKEKRHA
jgi:endonuclease-3 related protein